MSRPAVTVTFCRGSTNSGSGAIKPIKTNQNFTLQKNASTNAAVDLASPVGDSLILPLKTHPYFSFQILFEISQEKDEELGYSRNK